MGFEPALGQACLSAFSPFFPPRGGSALRAGVAESPFLMGLPDGVFLVSNLMRTPTDSLFARVRLNSQSQPTPSAALSAPAGPTAPIRVAQ